MGFFKDFKKDFSQAVNELLPNDETDQEDQEQIVNTLDIDTVSAEEDADNEELRAWLEEFAKKEEADGALTDEAVGGHASSDAEVLSENDTEEIKNQEKEAECLTKSADDHDDAGYLNEDTEDQSEDIAEYLNKGPENQDKDIAEYLDKGPEDQSKDAAEYLNEGTEGQDKDIAEYLNEDTEDQSEDIAEYLNEGTENQNKDIAENLNEGMEDQDKDIAEYLNKATENTEALEYPEENIRNQDTADASKNGTDAQEEKEIRYPDEAAKELKEAAEESKEEAADYYKKNTEESEEEGESMEDNVDMELLDAMNAEEEANEQDNMEDKEDAAPKLKAASVAPDDEVTVITKGTVITGNISSDGSLDIMGNITGDVECLGKLSITGKIIGNTSAAEVYVNTERLEGSITSEGSVKIGLGTVVVGDVTATSGVFAGAVKGEIDINGPIVIDSTAIIKGNIKAKSVQINNGAVLEGFCSLSYAAVDVDNIFE